MRREGRRNGKEKRFALSSARRKALLDFDDKGRGRKGGGGKRGEEREGKGRVRRFTC